MIQDNQCFGCYLYVVKISNGLLKDKIKTNIKQHCIYYVGECLELFYRPENKLYLALSRPELSICITFNVEILMMLPDVDNYI